MSKLSATQVVIVCHVAGPRWSDDRANLKTAVAVAGAASGGDVSAPGGLFGVGRAGGAESSVLLGGQEAQAAYRLWESSGWTAFPAYRSGAYILWEPWAEAGIIASGAKAPPGVVTGDPVATAAWNIDNTVVDTGGALVQGAVSTAAAGANVLTFLSQPGSWIRIAKVVAGLGLVVVGAAVFVKTPRSAPNGP